MEADGQSSVTQGSRLGLMPGAAVEAVCSRMMRPRRKGETRVEEAKKRAIKERNKFL
jgi:hypothetical protein